MSGVSLVILAYNEEKNIENIVKRSIDVLKEISPDYELVLVDDGSRDKTGEIISKLASQNSAVKHVRHAVNQGMGDSLRDGYNEAQHELVSFLPADGQIPPDILKELYDEIQHVDYVVTVYSKRGTGAIRKIMSETIRALICILFGPVPRLDGVYMFRKHMLKTIPLVSKTFVLNFEFVIRAYKQKYSHKKVSMVCLPRKEGRSKIANLKKIFQVFGEVVSLRMSTVKGYS